MLLLGSACSSGKEQAQPTPAASNSGTSIPTPTPSATAKPKTPPSAKKVVYAKDGDLWLYTVASDSLRRLTSSAADEYDPKFIDSDRISFLTYDEPEATIHEMRLSTKARKIIFRSQNVGQIMVHAWSPARSTIAYFTADHTGEHHALRYFVPSSKSNKTIRAFGAFEARDASQDDSVYLEWASDGKAVLVVATPFTTKATLFVARASQPNVIPARRATFGHFSRDGKRVYYRELDDPQTWFQVTVPGDVATALNMTRATFRISVSQDGGSLAFDDGAENPSTYVYPFGQGTQRLIGPGIRPLWLSKTTLAVEKTVPCPPTAPEPCFEPYRSVGKVVRLSLTGGSPKALKLGSTSGDVLYQ